MTAPIPERVALWTVANHDTYATLHRPDGTIAARFHVIAECEAVARVLNAVAVFRGSERMEGSNADPR